MGYYDTDVAEFLYKKKPQITQLVDYLCKDLSKACSTKPPPVPKVTAMNHFHDCYPRFMHFSVTV